VRAAREWLGDHPFLTLYGDNLFDVQLDRVIDCHRAAEATLTMALFQRTDIGSSGVAELDLTDRVVRFIEKPAFATTESRWVNAGLLVCEPSVIDAIPPSLPSDFGRDVIPTLIDMGRRVQGYRMGEGETLHWIDTPADLDTTEQFMASTAAR
jgi:NDP-sugar pyrophosphorylase family protein